MLWLLKEVKLVECLLGSGRTVRLMRVLSDLPNPFGGWFMWPPRVECW